jgi:endogenous inhibitor of DNA gyrase (YacG/DUF329 family)
MKCPICKKEVKLHDPEMPFCSERCREIDLGNWAMERYVISEPISSAGPSAVKPSDANPDEED